jgi:SAM-dependent methyltransferase
MPPEALSMPVPGDGLMARVAGGADRASFFWSGRESVRELERTLAIVGRSLDSFGSILDFGCGCGRMLLWLEHLGRARALYGTDIDGEAIEWCRHNIPWARVSVNEVEPPLPFGDGAFDLVFNHSVFTHVDERRQDMWLSELRRVARPGAMIVLSVHGEVALPEGAWALRDRLEQDGIAYLDNSSPRELGLPDWYQNAWHAPWYVFEHWGRWFAVRAYVPGGALSYQDHILLERTAGEAQAPVAARPRLAAEGRPASRVQQALSDAQAYRHQRDGARLGSIRTLARRAILRAIRPYTAHEDNLDAAVATSIEELTRAIDHHAQLLERFEESHDETSRREDTGASGS